jgi:DNA-damage-inducible protein D
VNENKIAIFQGKHIRKVLHNDQWWFSIIDIIEVLVGGGRLRKYWNDLKKKLIAEGYVELSEKIGQLKKKIGANKNLKYGSIAA